MFAIFAGLYLLVAEDVRADAQRAARQVAVLDRSSSASTVAFLPQHLLGLEGMPRRDLHVRERELGGLQPRLDDRLVRHGDRDPALHRGTSEDDGAAGRASATTRGRRTRSSGTRRRRRRRTTFDEVPYVTSARPLVRPAGGSCVSSVASARPSLSSSARVTPGALFRLVHDRECGRRSGSSSSSAVLELGTAHWGLAARRAAPARRERRARAPRLPVRCSAARSRRSRRSWSRSRSEASSPGQRDATWASRRSTSAALPSRSASTSGRRCRALPRRARAARVAHATTSRSRSRGS